MVAATNQRRSISYPGRRAASIRGVSAKNATWPLLCHARRGLGLGGGGQLVKATGIFVRGRGGFFFTGARFSKPRQDFGCRSVSVALLAAPSTYGTSSPAFGRVVDAARACAQSTLESFKESHAT